MGFSIVPNSVNDPHWLDPLHWSSEQDGRAHIRYDLSRFSTVFGTLRRLHNDILVTAVEQKQQSYMEIIPSSGNSWPTVPWKVWRRPVWLRPLGSGVWFSLCDQRVSQLHVASLTPIFSLPSHFRKTRYTRNGNLLTIYKVSTGNDKFWVRLIFNSLTGHLHVKIGQCRFVLKWEWWISRMTDFDGKTALATAQ